MFCAVDTCTNQCSESEFVVTSLPKSDPDCRKRFLTTEEILYPSPEVRWLSGLEKHPSFLGGLSSKGIEAPTPATGLMATVRHAGPSADSNRSKGSGDQNSIIATQVLRGSLKEDKSGNSSSTRSGTRSSISSFSTCSGNESLLRVVLDRVLGLSPPTGASTGHSYSATAFYQSEAHEVRDARRTSFCKSSASKKASRSEDCVFDTTISLPLRHREQFVKVAIYAPVGGGEVLVGEASVPVADWRATSLASWPLVFDFADGGEVMLHLEFVERQNSSDFSTRAKYQELPQSTTSLGFKVGDKVEVFSKSVGRWLHSQVVQLDESCLTVSSGDLSRRINPRDKDLHSYVRIPSTSIQ